MYKRIPGTKDILPEEVTQWQRIERISRDIFYRYNFQEIRTPLIEDIRLFNRSLGDSTEIVQKQMFVIKRENDEYVLRPEGTASLVRAYIENALDKTQGLVKLFYIGPMFRAERPQKGRLRQFHHIGCEIIGVEDVRSDIEMIALADHLLKTYSITDATINLNSLGCTADKQRLTAALRDKLRGKVSSLCEDCQVRFENNILRVLDCKNEVCQQIVTKLDVYDDHLCPACQERFQYLREGLDRLGIAYRITPFLVRGLDYYTGTVFEITHSRLGAQDALGAGGRYDNLAQELGGQPKGAIGFAFGVERLLLAIGDAFEDPMPQRRFVYFIFLGEAAQKRGMELLQQVRKAGIAADTDYEKKSLKGALRKADDEKATSVVIVGEDELNKNIITLKDMTSGSQKEVPIEKLVEELQPRNAGEG
jgi:histidyl-tRNA synthetase